MKDELGYWLFVTLVSYILTLTGFAVLFYIDWRIGLAVGFIHMGNVLFVYIKRNVPGMYL